MAKGKDGKNPEILEVEASLFLKGPSKANIGLVLCIADGSAMIFSCDDPSWFTFASSPAPSLVDVVRSEFTGIAPAVSPSAIAKAGDWKIFRFTSETVNSALAITSVSILVAGDASPIEFNLGHIRVSTNKATTYDVPHPPENVQAKVSWRMESVLEGELIADVHLFWKNAPSSYRVRHVDIYDADKEEENGQPPSWIARSHCEAVTLFSIKFDEKKEKKRKFRLVAVGHGGPTSTSTATYLTVSYC